MINKPDQHLLEKVYNNTGIIHLLIGKSQHANEYLIKTLEL